MRVFIYNIINRVNWNINRIYDFMSPFFNKICRIFF